MKPQGLFAATGTRKMNETERSTPFSLLIREIPELDSLLGYRTSNIDFVWAFEPDEQYLLLEEKRFGASIKDWQMRVFRYVDQALRLSGDPNYYGFHTLVFEGELPSAWRQKIHDPASFLAKFDKEPIEGKMRLDGREITIDELIEFLSFRAHEMHYRSFCDPERLEEFWEPNDDR
jgi:hypothetical protein